MSVISGFYDSLKGDRKYSSRDFNNLFGSLLNDGVFPSVGDKFIIKPGDYMSVTVGSGRAWFSNSWIDNNTTITLLLKESEPIMNRKDRIVFEFNKLLRQNSIKVLTGIPDFSNPQAPKLIFNEDVKQYVMAEITIKAGVEHIENGDITNCVGTPYCPFATIALSAGGVTPTPFYAFINVKYSTSFQAKVFAMGNGEHHSNTIEEQSMGYCSLKVNSPGIYDVYILDSNTGMQLHSSEAKVSILGDNVFLDYSAYKPGGSTVNTPEEISWISASHDIHSSTPGKVTISGGPLSNWNPFPYVEIEIVNYTSITIPGVSEGFGNLFQKTITNVPAGSYVVRARAYYISDTGEKSYTDWSVTSLFVSNEYGVNTMPENQNPQPSPSDPEPEPDDGQDNEEIITEPDKVDFLGATWQGIDNPTAGSANIYISGGTYGNWKYPTYVNISSTDGRINKDYKCEGNNFECTIENVFISNYELNVRAFVYNRSTTNDEKLYSDPLSYTLRPQGSGVI